MDKETRNAIERATQRARKLLEEDFAAQLEGEFDVHRDGAVAAKAGGHLSARQAFQRERVVAAIEHKRAAGMSAADAARDYLRDAAFTTLNRFVALKMLEARDLMQECITKGEQSAGYREFCGMAPGLPLLPDSAGYRLYIESLFDELSTEVKVLFDRRDPSSVLWPKRATFDQLLDILNATELSGVWGEDETIGWVYQFFNGQDERRQMREESSAPRNSRELAVRNQFFTPRYVVQFLTDNTLGRIWYEMRGTKTTLADRCEYMVHKPGEEFAPRAKKDPRDLRVLDPACGSGHFLLYAFDLLLTIYEEAYGDGESPKSEPTGRTLAEDYPSLDALRKAAPGLVLAHNLHGVDIDPRCAQIAQLALWMRAQKAYRDFGIDRAERAQIRRSNIVVAEPLVADEQVAEEFVAKLGDEELARVFTGLVESLKQAGELGLLLRVESVVGQQSTRGQTGNLFSPSPERIHAALARLRREVGGRTNTRRRLFAEDTAQGFGLFSIAERAFDLVLMNPPFGSFSAGTRSFASEQYPEASTDILCAFVLRVQELLHAQGLLGAITSRTGFFNESLAAWRRHAFGERRLRLFADLGEDVLDDAMVEVAAYTATATRDSRPTKFIRAVASDDKPETLRDGSHAEESASVFSLDTEDFMHVRLNPFAYWVSPRILKMAAKGGALEPHWAEVRSGLQTNDDVRFVRLRWEVLQSDIAVCAGGDRAWVGILKSDAAMPWLSDIDTLVKWHKNGRELKALVEHKGNSVSRHVPNEAYYFRPGVSWVKRSTRCVPTLVPAGVIPTVSRYIAYPTKGYEGALLGLLASDLVSAILRWNAEKFVWPIWGTRLLKNLWVPALSAADQTALAATAREHVAKARRRLEGQETSSWFVCPNTSEGATSTLFPLRALGSSLEEAVRDAYGFSSEEEIGVLRDIREAMEYRQSARGDEVDSEDNQDGESSTPGDVSAKHRQLSYAMGLLWGRWDARSEQVAARAAEADVFEFQVAPPALLSARPVTAQSAYPIEILSSGIAHDDSGGKHDIVRALANVVAHTSVEFFPDSASSLDDIRAYLAREFFSSHLRQYASCRRKAPIYWQLATPSASYSVWLYIHAFTKDTLFRVQNDYIGGEHGKLAHEERRLESLKSELRERATGAQRKALASQESFVEELRTLLDEVKLVAPLWKPNLDDGVIINFAPLWRLVPQNKAWQKELKSTWDALTKGKYNWAHLAMHLWPERVVPDCAKDRSLAIAHGLEDVFWVEGTDGKWTARKTPTRSVDELVRERTSPAVKAALRSLLEAPAAAGKSGGRRGGGRRKGAAASDGGDA